MKWYWIVLITYIITCLITLMLTQINEDYALYWAVGIPTLIIWILLYPVRAWYDWEESKNYYKMNGVSRWQYILGKRVKDEYD